MQKEENTSDPRVPVYVLHVRGRWRFEILDTVNNALELLEQDGISKTPVLQESQSQSNDVPATVSSCSNTKSH